VYGTELWLRSLFLHSPMKTPAAQRADVNGRWACTQDVHNPWSLRPRKTDRQKFQSRLPCLTILANRKVFTCDSTFRIGRGRAATTRRICDPCNGALAPPRLAAVPEQKIVIGLERLVLAMAGLY
jgi:hypothetical protein